MRRCLVVSISDVEAMTMALVEVEIGKNRKLRGKKKEIKRGHTQETETGGFRRREVTWERFVTKRLR
jgi:hypothetical protein